jgi:transcriptional regulator with XRE-family HTH domain
MDIGKENVAKELKKLCIDKGTSLTRICKTAGVDRSTLRRWELDEPQSIKMLRKLLLELK